MALTSQFMCLHHRIFLRALLGVFSRPSQSPRKPGFRTSDSPVLAVPWDGAAAPSNISSRDKISTSISLILTRPFVWCAGIIASKCPTSPDIPAKIERGVPRGRAPRCRRERRSPSARSVRVVTWRDGHRSLRSSTTRNALAPEIRRLLVQVRSPLRSARSPDPGLHQQP